MSDLEIVERINCALANGWRVIAHDEREAKRIRDLADEVGVVVRVTLRELPVEVAA